VAADVAGVGNTVGLDVELLDGDSFFFHHAVKTRRLEERWPKLV
jgi:hypothetical protein